VKVHVEDGLPGQGAGVENKAVVLLQPLLFRDSRRRGQHVSHDRRLVGGEGSGIRVVCLRYDKHVRGRLGVDVPEGQRGVGLVDDVGRNLTRDELAEEAVGHVVSLVTPVLLAPLSRFRRVNHLVGLRVQLA
jgi:hypothetical protein